MGSYSLWLIPVLPAAAAVVSLALTDDGHQARGVSPAVGRRLVSTALVLSFALSVPIIAEVWRSPDVAAGRLDVLGAWIPKLPVATRDATGILEVSWALRLDRKSAALLLAALVSVALALVRASRPPARESRLLGVSLWPYLGATLGLLVLVSLGHGLLMVFAGLTGIVALSALMMRGSDAGADVGAELPTLIPVGLAAFVLAIGFTFVTFGSLDIRAVDRAAANMPLEIARWGPVSTITFLSIIGLVLTSGAFGLVAHSARRFARLHPTERVSIAIALSAWLPCVAAFGVLWQVATLAMRAPTAIGVAGAIGGLALFFTHRLRTASR
ncbi:MAG: hypothetical protein FJW27_08580 [Acidimicrobiia bacterium]|nr:hypothetical protein [Acidimicrobiia bacterium]